MGAACEIASRVNSDGGPELKVGLGVNTGRVVAGSIGGAGRLNFSVIGDAVNVAARVEAATRDGADDLLLTRATADALVRTDVPLSSRGHIPLKGKSDPVELLAPERQLADASLLTPGGARREPRDPPVRPLP